MTVVGFGEIILRLKAPNGLRINQNAQFDIEFGGAEANTCTLLALLGLKTKIISALPDNAIAESALQFYNKFGVDVSNVLQTGERIGVYYVEDGNGIRPSQVIYDRKHTSFASLGNQSFDWDKIFDNSTLFHWTGISTAISQSAADCCHEAIKMAVKKNVLISCDFNYRRSLWYYQKSPNQIMPELIIHSHIIVADFDALKEYLGIETDTKASFEKRFADAAEKLKPYVPNLQQFGMTFRKVTDAGIYYFGAIYSEGTYCFSEHHLLNHITDPIGAGDAFTAGIIYGTLSKANAQTTINMAVAAGVLKHSIKGDVALINKSEIDYFLENGSTFRIKR